MTEQQLRDTLAEERHIQNDSGFNTEFLYSPLAATNVTYVDPVVGKYVTLIQQKEKQLRSYKHRIKQINSKIGQLKLTQAEINKLNREKVLLEQEIEGMPEQNKQGLENEIAQLKAGNNILPLGYYVEKDLERLKRLTDSNNLDDLNEAESIINFYILAGKFEIGVANPFFDEGDIFIMGSNGKPTTDYKLPEHVINQYQEWANRAVAFMNVMVSKKKQLFVDSVNNNQLVRETYNNKEFTYDELKRTEEGLKDASFADMWLMDITQGIFSTNGIIPQVIYSMLHEWMANDLKYAREFEARVDELNPKVIKKLKSIKQTLRAHGIDADGVTYQLFKEITKDGNETGGIIQKFVKEFWDTQGRVKDRFNRNIRLALSQNDDTVKRTMFKRAFKDLRNWRRMNTHIIEFTKLPEIIADQNFSDFKNNFSSTADADAYKQHLVNLLGEKEYNKQVEQQKKLLRQYLSKRDTKVDLLMESEKVNDIAKLSPKAIAAINYWKQQHSPIQGMEDYYKVIDRDHIDNYSTYNVFIPRKNEVVPAKDATGKRYVFNDVQSKTTGYYNTTFEKFIEKDEDLSAFHDLLMEMINVIKDVTPAELLNKMSWNSFPAVQKTASEVLNEQPATTSTLKRVFESFLIMWDKVRESFGVVRQSEISTAEMDPLTKEWSYKVNDQFLRGNRFAIKNKMKIEEIKLLQAINDPNLKEIKRYSVLDLSRFTPSALALLGEYLNIESPTADKIQERLGSTTVDIGRIIRDYSLHQVVQTQSFDLAKVAKYSMNMAMMYSARAKALPMIELLKKHYEDIRTPRTNNLGFQLKNLFTGQKETEGRRGNAIRQFENWFGRVVLDNYGLKQKYVFGGKGEKAILGKIIYSREDKKRLNEINELLQQESDENKIRELEDIKQHLGKVRTLTAAFDNLLAWIRTMRLGYNISSGITNAMEGYFSNMLVAASGEYFDPNEIYYGYHVIKHSFIRNATFGKFSTGLARKNRILMDKFRVLMDTKNELQKSSVRTYSDRLSWATPMALNQRVEFNNQSPLMIAMLRTMKVTGINGEQSSVWDALEIDGTLKPAFQTEENKKNWHDLTGDQYKEFKQKLGAVIVKAHGNYDELKGMMAKSNVIGKAVIMFKTWLPQQLYWRFATQQDDISTGTIGFKGRYWSYTPATAALHGVAVGSLLFGPFGSLIGMGIGAAAGSLIQNVFHTDTGVGLLQESIISAKILLKKMIGMPVNATIGRKIIDTSGKEFDAWVNPSFTQQDANALKSNMSDIALQLTFLVTMLLVKGFFYDDDDDKDDTERKIHNFFVNRATQLANQAAMYVNPVELGSSIKDNAVWKYFQDLGKFTTELTAWMEGRDIKASGYNSGQSGLAVQFKKTFLPGLFKDGVEATLGMGNFMERQFEPTPWDRYFKSDETLEAEDIKRDRAEMKHELSEDDRFEEMREQLKAEGLPSEEIDKIIKKEIQKMVDEEIPTPYQMKKKGFNNRKEFLQSKQ